MISQEKFNEIESKYGCGYWNVCWEHACPCAVTVEDKGLSKELYDAICKESNRVSEMFDDEDYFLSIDRNENNMINQKKFFEYENEEDEEVYCFSCGYDLLSYEKVKVDGKEIYEVVCRECGAEWTEDI